MAVAGKSGSRSAFPVPPLQTPYQQALALAARRIRSVSDANLRALGAQVSPDNIVELAALDSVLCIDRAAGRVGMAGSAAPVGLAVCALHYLSADLPGSEPPAAGRRVSFRDIADLRGYYVPYSGRVLERITGRFGAAAAGLDQAARALGGRPEQIGDAGWRFAFFPHVPVWLTYFTGDDEFAPEANLLYNENITALLPPEDVIVMSELLAARLCGRKWAEMKR